MGAMTLAEFIKRTRDELIAGVAEEILTTNPIWLLMPWEGYAGSGITVNKEKTLGDADFYGLGDTIAAKAPSAVTPLLFRSTRCIGDAELDGLQVAESKSDINDLMSMEVASKSKSVGRKLQQGMATGDGTDPHMNSLHSMIDSGQYVTGGSGDIFDYMDALTQKILSKDGLVDWIMVHGRDALKIRTAYRKLGGVPMMEVKSGGRTFKVMEFNGIPVFTNNWLSITETAAGGALTGGALSSIYGGNFDDGTRKVGVSMIHPEATPAGITVSPIGQMETKDQEIYRVKSYSNFASFNKLGIARVTDMPA
jgi:hypothetical protein